MQNTPIFADGIFKNVIIKSILLYQLLHNCPFDEWVSAEEVTIQASISITVTS